MKSLVFDIETDGLQPTKVYCMSVLDVETQEQFNFNPKKLSEGVKLLQEADKLIGHNIIGFDIPVVKRLMNIDLSGKKLVDTLVLSRLFNPVRASHSLQAWGYKLQFPKIEFDDYTRYSEEMMKYCAQDVFLNYKVYEELKRESRGFTGESVNVEMDTYKITTAQRDYGFMLDKDKANKLLEELTSELNNTQKVVHKTFTPKINERVIYQQHKNDECYVS